MALFQISEPDQVSDPQKAHRLAVGIDLGTTHSLIATVRGGQATIIRDECHNGLLPSVVFYSPDGDIQVGRKAMEHEEAIFSIKRSMGYDHQSDPGQTTGFDDVRSKNGQWFVSTAHGDKTPAKVSSEILKTLKSMAESSLGKTITDVVVTVPAYFDDVQRQATKEASQLANLNVLRLLNEPTAAAVAYGLDQTQEDGHYLIYDLGGGTFDVSILHFQKGIFEVLATAGDTHLGGDDIDESLAQHIHTVQPVLSLALCRKLARSLKEKLSESSNCDIRDFCDNPVIQSVVIDQECLARVARPWIERTLRCAQRALFDANLSVDQLKQVILVGGGTRMPMVRHEVENFFGRQVLCSINPDEVVAVGAAMQAHALTGQSYRDQDWLLLDVIPLSLGLETMGGLVEKLIPRNSTLPLARTQEFTTYKDGQIAMSIHVLQGEREKVENCRSLAHFILRGIPPMPAGMARVRVTFQVDADGLLSVFAQEVSTGIQASIDVKPAYGLDEQTMSQMLTEAFQHAETDLNERRIREKTVDAKLLCEAIEKALLEDEHLLSEEAFALIKEKVADLQTLLAAAGHVISAVDLSKLEKAMEDLEKTAETFSALRMDQSIQKALLGRSVNDL